MDGVVKNKLRVLSVNVGDLRTHDGKSICLEKSTMLKSI